MAEIILKEEQAVSAHLGTDVGQTNHLVESFHGQDGSVGSMGPGPGYVLTVSFFPINDAKNTSLWKSLMFYLAKDHLTGKIMAAYQLEAVPPRK